MVSEITHRFAKVLEGFHEGDYHPDQKLEDVLEDSLEVVEFGMGIEQEFDIEITDEDFKNETTIYQALTKVKEKLNV